MTGVRVYASRHAVPKPPGHMLKWDLGQKAKYTTLKGEVRIVTIDSEMMSHAAAPGNGFVYECIFEDGSGRFACLADRLEDL